jgi:hypothetical protein
LRPEVTSPSARDQSRPTRETEQPPVAGWPAKATPLLFDKRVPLSERQTGQYEGTEAEVDPKPDVILSDVNAKEHIVPVAWR